MEDFEFITESIRISGDDRVDCDSHSCGCRPSREGEPICIDSKCINFATQVECARCGPTCGNRRLTNKEYAKLEIRDTHPKGRGVFAIENIPEGGLVGEYLGEIINAKELERRVGEMNDRGEHHMYVMALQGKTYVDSRYKGSIIRFMNHSCEPNCTLERWTVRGRMRLAIFALRDIAAGEEISVDYNWRLSGRPPTRCYCRTPSCRGFLEVFNNDDITAMLSRRGVWVSCRERLLNMNNNNSNINIMDVDNSADNTEKPTSLNSIFNKDGTINAENLVGKYLKVFYPDANQYSETRVEKYLGDGRYVLFDILRNYSYEEASLEDADANWYYLDESVAASINKKRSSNALSGDNADNSCDDEDLSAFPIISAPVAVTNASQKRARINEASSLPEIISQTIRIRLKSAAYLVRNNWLEGMNNMHIDGLLEEKQDLSTLIEHFITYSKAIYGLKQMKRVLDHGEKRHPYSFDVEIHGDTTAITALKRALVHAQESVSQLEKSYVSQKRKQLSLKQGCTLLHDWRIRPLVGLHAFGTNYFSGVSPLSFSTFALQQEGLEMISGKLIATWMQIMFQQNQAFPAYRKNETFALSYAAIPQLLLSPISGDNNNVHLVDEQTQLTYSAPVPVGGNKTYDLPRVLDREMCHLLYLLCQEFSIVPTVTMASLMMMTRFLQANFVDERTIAREKIQYIVAVLVIAHQAHHFPRLGGYIPTTTTSLNGSNCVILKHKHIKKWLRTVLALVQHREVEEIAMNVVDAIVPMVLEKCYFLFQQGLQGDLYVMDVVHMFGHHFLHGHVSPMAFNPAYNPSMSINLTEEQKFKRKEDFDGMKKEYKQQMTLWSMWQELLEEVSVFLWWLRIETGPCFFVGCAWQELHIAIVLAVYLLQRELETDFAYSIDATPKISKREQDFHEKILEHFVLFVMKKTASMNALSFANVAQSLLLLTQSLSALFLASIHVPSAMQLYADMDQKRPSVNAEKPSIYQRLQALFSNNSDQSDVYASMNSNVNDALKLDQMVQQLRLRMEMSSLKLMQGILEKLTQEVAIFHHASPATMTQVFRNAPVRMIPLSEAMVSVTTSIPLNNVQVEEKNTEKDLSAHNTDKNTNNATTHSLLLHPFMSRVVSATVDTEDSSETPRDFLVEESSGFLSKSTSFVASGALSNNVSVLPVMHTIEISPIDCRVVTKEIVAVEGSACITDENSTQVPHGSIRAWPFPRNLQREVGKAQIALSLPTSGNAPMEYSPWKLSSEALRELSLLQHLQQVSLTCLSSVTSSANNSSNTNSVRESMCTHVAFPASFVHLTLSATSMENKTNFTDSDQETSNSPSFKQGLYFPQHVVLCTCHQMLSSAEYTNLVPLYVRWQWTQDLLRVASFFNDAGVVFPYLDTEHDVCFTVDGKLLIVGLSAASLYADTRHPYQSHSVPNPPASTVTPTTKRKSNASSSGKDDDASGVDWPSHSYPFLAPELLLGGVSTPATTSYATMMLLFYLLTGKTLLKNSKNVAKQLDYVYKLIGTPKMNNYAKEIDILPFTEKYGKVLSDGSECKAKVGKAVRATLAESDILRYFSSMHTEHARAGNNNDQLQEEGMLVDVLKRSIDLIPQKRCLHFAKDHVLQMPFFTQTHPEMTRLLARDNVQLLFWEEHVDLTQSIRCFSVPVSVRRMVMARLFPQNNVQAKKPVQHTDDKSLIGVAAISFVQDADISAYERSHHYHAYASSHPLSTAPVVPRHFAIPQPAPPAPPSPSLPIIPPLPPKVPPPALPVAPPLAPTLSPPVMKPQASPMPMPGPPPVAPPVAPTLSPSAMKPRAPPMPMPGPPPVAPPPAPPVAPPLAPTLLSFPSFKQSTSPVSNLPHHRYQDIRSSDQRKHSDRYEWDNRSRERDNSLSMAANMQNSRDKDNRDSSRIKDNFRGRADSRERRRDSSRDEKRFSR